MSESIAGAPRSVLSAQRYWPRWTILPLMAKARQALGFQPPLDRARIAGRGQEQLIRSLEGGSIAGGIFVVRAYMLQKPFTVLGTFAAILMHAGCGNPPHSVMNDFSTPEGAILRIEDAYRAMDIEAAVNCKDFRIEARLMLQSLQNLPDDQIDDEIIQKTAEVLELAFRKEISENGFPDMTGVRSTFPNKESRTDDIVIVTEVCHYPDGGTSKQRILVAKTGNGWRVLNPLD